MEYAHKVSKLVKGKMYLVAHAHIINKISDHHWADIPVIPIPHKDEAFAPLVSEHYHLDMRFGMPTYVKHKYCIQDAKSNHPVLIEDWFAYYVEKIIYLPKRCLRLNTGLNPPQDAVKYNNWYKSMLGKSCAGKRCPHYGATMIEDNGKMYCPMHNLHADPLTLKVVEPY